MVKTDLKQELNSKIDRFNKTAEDFSKLVDLVQSIGTSITEVKKDICSLQTQIDEEIKQEQEKAEQAKKKEEEKVKKETIKEHKIHEEITYLDYYKVRYGYFTDNEIVLKTNDIWTKCTQTRLNEFAATYDLGYYVRRVFVGTVKEQWYVEYNDKKIPFSSESITLKRNK